MSAEKETSRAVGVVIAEVIERAEQACRYVAKHNESAASQEERESEYLKGFLAACAICESAIRPHVERHMTPTPPSQERANPSPPHAEQLQGASAPPTHPTPATPTPE